MKFEIVTLFPEFFELSLRQSLLGKALEKKLFDIEIVNLRDFATDKHRTVDDRPFGGGAGMVLKVDVLDRCLQSLGCERAETGLSDQERERIVLTSAAGKVFDQRTAVRYSLTERLTIICGHYLGVDERILDLYRIDEVSVGDFVLSGGEPAATVLVDAVARLIPGMIGNFESALNDSHMDNLLGTPYYTRPAEYAGQKVPPTLQGGDHKEIDRFRRAEALRKCARNRADLLDKAELSDQDRELLDRIEEEETQNIERKDR